MFEELWFIRDATDDFNPDDFYGDRPEIFSLKFFHGGRFSSLPGRTYVNGKISFVHMVDSDQFSIHEIGDMVEKIGYPKEEVIHYHFRVPGHDLDFGLKGLVNDTDVLNLLKYVEDNKIIEIYVEHSGTRLSNNVIDDEVAHDDNVIDDELETDNIDSESEDSDFLIDEGDMVNEVVVDMNAFKTPVEMSMEIYDEDIVDEELELDDFDSLSDEENDPPLKKVVKKVRKDKKKQKKDNVVVPFYVGQAFSNREEIKDLVKRHGVDSRRQLCIVRNDKSRFCVVCYGKIPVFQGGGSQEGGSDTTMKKPRFPSPTCPWTLHISNRLNEDSWVVKTFKDEHRCLQTREVRLCNISFLAKEVQPILQLNPGIPLRALEEQLQKKFQVHVSKHKVFRAKVMANQNIQGHYREQYALLRDYCDELIRCNPGTTVKIDLEREPNPTSSTRQFRRIYVCLGAMKAGFKLCGRDIVGLDGCFIKGPYPGQVLTAVGVDSNNGIYPVAYAIVEAESFASWTWFLECLGDDLDLASNSNFTFISDRQKGIIPAIIKVFPSVEHRYCLRHIHENMKQRWRGQLYKNLLWKCASATTIVQFDKAMKEVQAQDQALYDWLKQIPPKHWSRAHFSGRAKSDILLNNLCEVFNKQLVVARDKPIITCLEYIREYMMKRIVVVHKLISKCDGPLTPNATKAFDIIKSRASDYIVLWNAINKYQVTGSSLDQYVVDVEKKTCTCRRWELTGMPCKHAVAVIWNMAVHGIEVGIPESWVSQVYWLDTWKKVYQQTIDPINGRDLWAPSTCPTTITPPKHHKQIGRPKKKRRKSADELSQGIEKNGKMTRIGNTVTCGICKQKGHNKRSCKRSDDPQ